MIENFAWDFSSSFQAKVAQLWRICEEEEVEEEEGVIRDFPHFYFLLSITRPSWPKADLS